MMSGRDLDDELMAECVARSEWCRSFHGEASGPAEWQVEAAATARFHAQLELIGVERTSA